MPIMPAAPVTTHSSCEQYQATAMPPVIPALRPRPTPGQKYFAFRTFLHTFVASYVRRRPSVGRGISLDLRWQESSVDVLARQHSYLYTRYISS